MAETGFGRIGRKLDVRSAGECERASDALEALRLGHAQRKAAHFAIELVVVAHHEGVAVPRFFLQRERPIHRAAIGGGDRLARADVRTSELHIFPSVGAGHADGEGLHTLIDDAKPNGGAAAQEAIADGGEVEDLGGDERLEAFGGKGDRPILLHGGEGEGFGCASGHFARGAQGAARESQARRGARGDAGGLAVEREGLFRQCAEIERQQREVGL